MSNINEQLNDIFSEVVPVDVVQNITLTEAEKAQKRTEIEYVKAQKQRQEVELAALLQEQEIKRPRAMAAIAGYIETMKASKTEEMQNKFNEDMAKEMNEIDDQGVRLTEEVENKFGQQRKTIEDGIAETERFLGIWEPLIN